LGKARAYDGSLLVMLLQDKLMLLWAMALLDLFLLDLQKIKVIICWIDIWNIRIIFLSISIRN